MVYQYKKPEYKLSEALLYVIRDNLTGDIVAYVFDASKITMNQINDIIKFLETGLPPELVKFTEPTEKWAFTFDKYRKTVVIYKQGRITVMS